MNIDIKGGEGHFGKPSDDIEVTVRGFNYSIAENVVDRDGKVDETLISELKYLVNVLEEQNRRCRKSSLIDSVVVELPSKNSKEFKDWIISEGYKRKGFGVYQKENKDYCYKSLYKQYCNILGFGN